MLSHGKENTLKRATITIDPEDYAVIDSLERTRFQLLIRRSMREILDPHHDSNAVDLPGKSYRAS
ncbi:MAG: hypothetical protein HY848_04790 [Betaproteobacteria bacterium]|nr:hypothetical protein [Betaproteobacteria bacterium]